MKMCSLHQKKKLEAKYKNLTNAFKKFLKYETGPILQESK